MYSLYKYMALLCSTKKLHRNIGLYPRFRAFSTAVPLWGQTTWNLTGLSPKRESGTRGLESSYRAQQQHSSSNGSSKEVPAANTTGTTAIVWQPAPLSTPVHPICAHCCSTATAISQPLHVSGSRHHSAGTTEG